MDESLKKKPSLRFYGKIAGEVACAAIVTVFLGFAVGGTGVGVTESFRDFFDRHPPQPRHPSSVRIEPGDLVEQDYTRLENLMIRQRDQAMMAFNMVAAEQKPAIFNKWVVQLRKEAGVLVGDPSTFRDWDPAISPADQFSTNARTMTEVIQAARAAADTNPAGFAAMVDKVEKLGVPDQAHSAASPRGFKPIGRG